MTDAILYQRLGEGAAANILIFAVPLAVLAFMGIGSLISNAVRRWRLARRYDFGPNANALWADLDDHFDDYLANNPDIAAGLSRLRAAVRDEQRKGRQA